MGLLKLRGVSFRAAYVLPPMAFAWLGAVALVTHLLDRPAPLSALAYGQRPAYFRVVGLDCKDSTYQLGVVLNASLKDQIDRAFEGSQEALRLLQADWPMTFVVDPSAPVVSVETHLPSGCDHEIGRSLSQAYSQLIDDFALRRHGITVSIVAGADPEDQVVTLTVHAGSFPETFVYSVRDDHVQPIAYKRHDRTSVVLAAALVSLGLAACVCAHQSAYWLARLVVVVGKKRDHA